MLLALLLTATHAPSNAIIWRGADTETIAREMLAAWPKEEGTWSSRVKLAEGYPKLVKSYRTSLAAFTARHRRRNQPSSVR